MPLLAKNKKRKEELSKLTNTELRRLYKNLHPSVKFAKINRIKKDDLIKKLSKKKITKSTITKKKVNLKITTGVEGYLNKISRDNVRTICKKLKITGISRGKVYLIPEIMEKVKSIDGIKKLLK